MFFEEVASVVQITINNISFFVNCSAQNFLLPKTENFIVIMRQTWPNMAMNASWTKAGSFLFDETDDWGIP